MKGKITWRSVYEDFRARYPNLRKEVTYWRPYDYLTIELYFNDGKKGTYDYLTHKIQFLKEGWIRD